MKRITCVTPYVPYAQIPHAGGQFLFHYLSRVVNHLDVTLVAPDVDGNRAAVSVGPPGVDVHLVSVKPLPTRLLARTSRYVRMSSNGLTLGRGEMDAFEADRIARDLIADSDVVEIQWSELLPLVPVFRRWNPASRVVAVEHDVRYQSVRSRAEKAIRRRDRVLATVAAWRVRHREPALLNMCDAVLTFTEKDVRMLRTLGVTVPAHVLAPYLVRPKGEVGPAAEPTVLFVGAFDRPENAEAAFWFLEKVWPAVRDGWPDAVLVLAGARPPDELLQRAAPDVRVTGFVDDLDPLYRASRLVVCPLRSGGGLKFKVPQAMSYGLPVVASVVAAEGIVERSGYPAFGAVTDDATEMAAAVVSLLRDRALAFEVGSLGRAWALDAYRFEESVDAVLDLYARLA